MCKFSFFLVLTDWTVCCYTYSYKDFKGTPLICIDRESVRGPWINCHNRNFIIARLSVLQPLFLHFFSARNGCRAAAN